MTRRKNQAAPPAAVQLLTLPDVHQRLVAELGWDDVHRRPAGYDGWVPEDDRILAAEADRVGSLAEKAGVVIVPGEGVPPGDVDVMVAFARDERAHIEASRLRSEAANTAAADPDAVWTMGVVGATPALTEAEKRQREYAAGLTPVKPGTYSPSVVATFGPAR